MVAVVATFKVQPGTGEFLESVFRDLAQKVRENEPECQLYQLVKSQSEPDSYQVLELYTDQAALDRHFQTEYFKGLRSALKPLLAEAPAMEIFTLVN